LRIVYASAGGNGEATAAALRDALPPGTTCEALHGDALRRRLAGGGVDAVVYPFDETFPADTHDDVVAFVMRGGVLVDLGGMPMWRPVTEPEPGRFVRLDDDEAGEARRKLRISAEAWWTAPALPREDRAFPTAAARAAGFRGDPAGELANRFQTPRFLRDGDKFTPLLTTPGGAVAASLTHLAEGGCVVVGGARRKGAAETITEETQARYLVRSLAICFAEGVGQYFWYELRANENDPFYSENHFGLMHHNLTPKPAWGAYLNFTLARPSGSEQKPGPWRDGACGLYFPQWTRPDGTPAGVIWKTGAAEKMALRFAAADGTTAADVRFRTCTGRLLKPARGADGAWIVAVGEEPVFFEGALLDAGALLRQRQNQGLEP